jgi:hypothetical protein
MSHTLQCTTKRGTCNSHTFAIFRYMWEQTGKFKSTKGKVTKSVLITIIDEKGYRWEKELSSSYWMRIFRPF